MVALFEMLCQRSVHFVDVIPLKHRMPNTPCSKLSTPDPTQARHLLDRRLTTLVNCFFTPNRGISSHQLMYGKLLDYFDFCEYPFYLKEIDLVRACFY